MNLVSCGKCGVVVDANQIEKPEILFNEDGGYNDKVFTWDEDGEDYVPCFQCPVCKNKIAFP